MRLVVCDTQLLLAQPLVWALLEAGHDVACCCEDLDQLPSVVARERPDVFLVERSYAGRDRLAELVTLRPSLSGTHLLVLTDRADHALWNAFDDLTLDAVVSKSCSFDVLDRTLRQAGEGRRRVVGFARPETCTPAARAAALTLREQQVLRLLADGLPTTSIAEGLSVSRNTVRTHVSNILRKLDVPDRAKAVRDAVHHGLVDTSFGGQP